VAGFDYAAIMTKGTTTSRQPQLSGKDLEQFVYGQATSWQTAAAYGSRWLFTF
jgi:hypothetical protein